MLVHWTTKNEKDNDRAPFKPPQGITRSLMVLYIYTSIYTYLYMIICIYMFRFPTGYPYWKCLFYSHLLLSAYLHPLLAIVATTLYPNASRIVSLWIQRATAPNNNKRNRSSTEYMSPLTPVIQVSGFSQQANAQTKNKNKSMGAWVSLPICEYCGLCTNVV